MNRPVTMAFESGFVSALHTKHPGQGLTASTQRNLGVPLHSMSKPNVCGSPPTTSYPRMGYNDMYIYIIRVLSVDSRVIEPEMAAISASSALVDWNQESGQFRTPAAMPKMVVQTM